MEVRLEGGGDDSGGGGEEGEGQVPGTVIDCLDTRETSTLRLQKETFRLARTFQMETQPTRMHSRRVPNPLSDHGRCSIESEHRISVKEMLVREFENLYSRNSARHIVMSIIWRIHPSKLFTKVLALISHLITGTHFLNKKWRPLQMSFFACQICSVS